MSTWRAAGLNYMNYSNIAARTLRLSLKGKAREDAMKLGDSQIKIYFWSDGNILPLGQKPSAAGGGTGGGGAPAK